MSREIRDPQHAARAVQRRTLRAVMPALRRLDRVARGVEPSFRNDHQFRACVALARLAPHVLARLTPDGNDHPDPFDDPSWHTPRHELLSQRLQYLASLSPEQRTQREAERKAAFEVWEKESPGRFETPQVCMEWHRTHKVRHISEVEDELWPPHLRMSSLKPEDRDE